MAYHSKLRIEWDARKADANWKKHKVRFEAAGELLASDAPCLHIYDEHHSINETRFFAIGHLHRGTLCVVYTEICDDTLRIISARKATARERKLFVRYIEELSRQ